MGARLSFEALTSRRIMPHRHTVTQLPDAELGPQEVDDLTATAAELLRERAEIVLNSIASGIFCLDNEGRTIFVNEAGARMFGFSPREMLGRPQHALIHHHYSDGTPFPEEECPISATVHEGITQRVGGDAFWRKDGTQLPVDYTSIPLKQGRRVVGAVVTFRDMSAEQRAERQEELLEEAERSRVALVASEERLRLAMSAGRMASWEWDLAGGVVHWSPEEEALYGLEPGTFEGTAEGYASRIHPDDREAVVKALDESLARKAEVHSVTHRAVWPGGEVRWLESYGRFIYDEAGNPLRLVGVSMDVTQRMSAQAEAGQMQRLLESAFESSPSAIVLTEGPDHTLRWANRLARELMGPDAVVGRPARAEEALLAIFDRVYRTGESYSAERVDLSWVPAGPGGSRHGRFNIVCEPLRDARGETTGVIAHAVPCA